MNTTYAYAHGALTKLAEHRVSPVDFINAAVQTQDPGALKIARAIVEYEKVANAGVMKGRKMLGQVGDAIGDAWQGVKNVGQDAMMNPFGEEGLVALARGGDELAPRAQKALAMQGAGLAGVGGLGALGMSDADTLQNQMANMANNNLGTDFGTQSRAGYGLEQLQNLLG